MQHRLHILVCAALLGTALAAGSCKKDSDAKPDNGSKTSSALLSSPQQGKPFSTGTINDFTLAYSNNVVVLLAVNNTTGMIYAIDIKDNDASQATANTITGSVPNFWTSVASKLGLNANTMWVANMEINPVSKSVYLLIVNPANNMSSLVKATNGGTVLTAINLDDVSYSAVKFSDNGEEVHDITWGDNKAYISFSHPTSLAGKLALASAPFNHGTAATTRSTTVFKTNWGGNYFTDAPLESMTYAEVAGEKRLVGVTVCAPGYSFKTSDINSGTGLLQVKEYFNLNTGFAAKIFPAKENGKTYMMELHQTGKIRRVGEKYLDESQAAASSSTARYLLDMGTDVPNGMTDEDIKLVSPAGQYLMIAGYGDAKFLGIDNTGTLVSLNI